MDLHSFNTVAINEAKRLLTTCCGSSRWVGGLMSSFPFANEMQLIKTAESVWYDQMREEDWLEAFSHHPQIGDTKSLAEKFASISSFAGKEQDAVNHASANTVESLAANNNEYLKKFGFIFIVCATGKSADTMLRLLNDRISNSREEELQVAMGEQYKITVLRLQKMLSDANWKFMKPGQLTTHVLDTSIGKPAENISIRCYSKHDGGWNLVTQGLTNSDGRIPDLLAGNHTLTPGVHKLLFDIGSYYEAMKISSFYPEVEIQFNIFDQAHYHVPLLLSPFGYSTYRGS